RKLMLNKAFKKFPILLQNSAITFFNTYQYKVRHGGAYKQFRSYYAQSDSLSESELISEVEAKKNNFFNYVKSHSNWYKEYKFDNLTLLPILEKIDIINHL